MRRARTLRAVIGLFVLVFAAYVALSYRRGSKQADLCDNCAGGMPGHAAARRGRRPKSVAA